MADPGSRPASGGSTEHLCQLSLGKWISGLNAHLVSRYRFVIYVISGIVPPEGVVIAGLLARVGADNPVTVADLVALCRMKTFELGIWLREAFALRHCQYP
jgi:hypothetical protein